MLFTYCEGYESVHATASMRGRQRTTFGSHPFFYMGLSYETGHQVCSKCLYLLSYLAAPVLPPLHFGLKQNPVYSNNRQISDYLVGCE